MTDHKEKRSLASRLTNQPQMSEAFVLSAVLAFSGGFQDAYTYIVRHGVFANGQTGNVVLMSTHLLAGEPAQAVRYLLPILAFAGGVWTAEKIGYREKYARKMHWRQIILVLELLILFAAGLLPDRYYNMANFLVSFSCAMQVQAFRTISGYSYATTMCVGNLRSGVEALSVYQRTGNANEKNKVKHYFGVIFIFAVGAGLGGNICSRIGVRAIWISCLFLLLAYGLMELDKYR